MTSIPNRKYKIQNRLLPWLDVLAISAWGILILKYWLTDKLGLLIHPKYFGIVIAGGFGLLIVSIFKAQEILQRRSTREVIPSNQHITLFPANFSSALLLFTAILGIMITPRVFASDTALQRDFSDLLTTSRPQPQAFRPNTRPEERSLVDWVRTLNVYPEPDAYTGQKVKVQGFAIHPPELGKEYLFLARFVITCCAADAYPIGLPVKLKEPRDKFPQDTWWEVEGQMFTENLSGKRQLTIAATSLKKIPQPSKPYSY
ncbi:TIGR03943 family putative permease subunit [Iningainema tapete]|uniref:TIGR03943 family protein n=1 Tax=Iningainema tapete BLCC-T55 TaxID=2748662 RepID=A0A8J7C4P1_9CYAN|nr:TIGR03943 family protein [Iningainema tapete]MBD2771809.1 TIGR03943 family protein [Iningainema tapete BLCC-T55]